MAEEPAAERGGGAPGKAALIAIVGRANVGKSSLLNAILGEKVSIESPVAQTTRRIVRGILTEPRGQLAFVDTPGIHRTDTDFGRLMNRAARAAAEGVDLVLLVLDGAAPLREEDHGWMRRLAHRAVPTPLVVALNKTDIAAPREAEVRAAWTAAAEGTAAAAPDWAAVSARTQAGIEALRERLFALAPAQPPLFPPDVLTDHPRQLAIADVVREKLFLRLHDEVPHRVAVSVEHLLETPSSWTVTAVIHVEQSSQKGIVIGHKGRMLRAVRRAAEAELRAIYGLPVTLDLVVRVEPHWTRNYWFLKRIGYTT